MKIRIVVIKRFFAFVALALVIASCSMTKNIPDGKSMLIANKVVVDGEEDLSVSDLNKYIKQSPKKGFLGWRPMVSLYNSGNGSGKGWDKFAKKIGKEPLIYDEDLVESSKSNLVTHLEYIGYFSSDVESSVETDRKRKTKVTYRIKPGVQYIIDTIIYNAKDTALLNIVKSHSEGTLLKHGSVLSENILEKESDRLTEIFRNSGYYGFSKNHFFFQADTLGHDGTAALEMTINEYTRNESPSEAKPHRVYRFGDVFVSTQRTFQRTNIVEELQNDPRLAATRDSLIEVWRSQVDTFKYKNINILRRSERGIVRNRFLNRMNRIRTGEKFSAAIVDNTYARLSSLGLFSSVNINLEEESDTLVKTNISLQASTLQGYKVNLQASTNSNGLIGISPSVSYYHKNLFRGAELLTVSLMGDFQSKAKSDIHSTEIGVGTSLDFPNFLFLPDSWFRSRVIPHTEFTVSYNYQNRPEYTRNIISGSFGYKWNNMGKWYFTISPVQANIVKLFDLDPDFYEKLTDPYLRNSYKNHFDLGMGANIYYTSDPSANPKSSYFYFRYNLSLSGNLLSLFNSSFEKNEEGEHLIWGSPYSQYYKMELATVYTFKFGANPSHMLAVRALGGVGKGYGNSDMVPFEKLFWGGGAYDMRGWQPRTLGPGYAPRDTAFAIPNQAGDIKLEGNIEYRFPISGALKGAVFVDAGNIWTFDRKSSSLWDNEVLDKRGVFTSKFYKQIALDWGVGIRLDLNFALLRLDLGFKTRDPAIPSWLGPNKWFKSNNYELSFGIGYPF